MINVTEIESEKFLIELERYLDELDSHGFVILSIQDTGMYYEVWYHDGVEETTELIPKGCIINK